MIRILTSLLMLIMLVSACAKQQPPSWRPAGAAFRATCPSAKPYQAGATCYAKPFDTVYFYTNRSDLTPRARIMIERQAAWLKTYEAEKVRVEGYAAQEGSAEDNYVLGLRRAQAVKDYLVALDINPDRIAIVSFGGQQAATRGKNRQPAAYRKSVSVVAEYVSP